MADEQTDAVDDGSLNEAQKQVNQALDRLHETIAQVSVPEGDEAAELKEAAEAADRAAGLVHSFFARIGAAEAEQRKQQQALLNAR